MNRHAEKGSVRPLWLMLGVLTCVMAGTLVNQCLTCAPAEREAPRASAAVQGELIGAARPETAEPSVKPPDTETIPLPQPQPEIVKPLPRLSELLEEKNKVELPEKKQRKRDGYLELTFDRLANWVYEFPEDPKKPRPDPVPEAIRKLTGEKVFIKGFMIPYKVDGEDVIEFLLVRDQMACCFGVVPKMNEWIHVKMAEGKKAPYAVDVPITIYGIFEAGELIEKGIVMSLYRMECTEVEEHAAFR